MGDEDYDYDGDYFEDGDNFFYVEETYALADDLTENVIPEPGGFYDVTDDWDDMTRFDYWNDIEYDSDGYNDHIQSPHKQASASIPESKSPGRKRKAMTEAKVNPKRPKLFRNQSTFLRDLPPIMFMPPLPERIDPVSDVSTMESYAILPDWRERFKDIKSVVNISNLARAPRVTDSADAPVRERLEDEEEDEELESEDMDPSAAMNALSFSLESHLTEAGLDTSRIDRSKLLSLAHKMMAQDEDAEDLLADFIEDMYAEDDDEENPLTQLLASTSVTKQSQSSITESDSLPDRNPSEDDHGPVPKILQEAEITSMPRSRGSSANNTGKKRKPESPETSPKKRRNIKGIPI